MTADFLKQLDKGPVVVTDPWRNCRAEVTGGPDGLRIHPNKKESYPIRLEDAVQDWESMQLEECQKGLIRITG